MVNKKRCPPRSGRLLPAILILGLASFNVGAVALAQGNTNLPPIVALTNPPSGAVFTSSSIIRLKATATDPDGGIEKVEFYEGTNRLDSVTQPPYNLFLTNVLRQRNDYYFLTTTATDDRGLTSTSPPVKILIAQDPLPPRVSLTSPREGEAFLFPASVDILATIVNHDGSENPVQIFSGTALVGSMNTPLYSVPVTNPPGQTPYIATYYGLALTNLPVGQHTLTATYTDNPGNKGTSQSVSITLTPLFLSDAAMLSGGRFRFDVGGLASGKSFEIQTSTNLSAWFSVATNIASSNIFHFVDQSATNRDKTFYRALQTLD